MDLERDDLAVGDRVRVVPPEGCEKIAARIGVGRRGSVRAIGNESSQYNVCVLLDGDTESRWLADAYLEPDKEPTHEDAPRDHRDDTGLAWWA